MTKQEFDTKKNSLLAEAKNFLKDGKVDEANAKIKEAEDLKAQYDAESKAAANIAALDGPAPVNQAPQQVAPAQATTGSVDNVDGEDPTNSLEYRRAFMNYVLKGEPMNATGVTKTSDADAVIPQTVVDRIIQKLEAIGNILPLITQTAYKGGVAIPVSLVKPTATWINEGADVSSMTKHEVKKTNSVVFSYYKLKVKVAITLEMDVMAMSAFETMISNNIAEAINRALEAAIINGTGSGQPKGILAETPATGQAVETAGTTVAYGDLITAEAALPLAYENGAVWCMSKKTFMAFAGMVDEVGQPIGRVNFGIAGAPERTLLGRKVVLNDNVSSAAGDVVAFLFNFKDDVLNTNLGMTVKTYEDNDTDDKVTKAVMLVDGKVVDKNSLVTVTLKSGS